MKLIKLLMLFLAGAFWTTYAAGQTANATLNILTLNSGQVGLGAVVDLQVTVGNTGPGSILANKVRAQISYPFALVNALPDAQQTGLPAGWSITVNNTATGTITICNNTDVIPAGTQRQAFIKLRGIAVGGPSTINGNLVFSNGTSCTIPGTLNGDGTADNTGTTSIQVIPAPSCSLTGVTASAGTIACNGGTTTLTATPTGATGAVEYSLTGGAPFQSGNTFIVGAGTYVVTAREVSTPACTATANAVSVTEPSAVTVPVVGIITQPTCATATGSAVLSGLPAGNWTINPGAIPGNTTTATINGLAQGTYNFTVTDAAGCTSAASADVVINAQPATPTAPVIGTITQPTCAVSTGSVVLSGLPPGNWMINPGVVPGNTTTATINGLASGTYNFTVTNAAGCTSAASTDVVIDDVTGAPPAPIVSITHPGCTIATGTVIITSGTTGLIFSLDGATYAAYPTGGYIVAPGLHTLTAQDAGGGCISAVENITINAQPPTPAAPIVNIEQPTCTIPTGIITITSGTTGLSFSLDGGAYAVYPAGGYIVAPGSHTLTAQNTSGCISALTNITVNAQPLPPTVSVSAGTIGCFGGTTILTVTASGGTAPFEYSLNGSAFQPDNTFIIGAGIQNVTVRDANLCTGTATVTLTQPTAISATASTGTIACNGGTITLTVSATGGIGTLQYSLNGGPSQPGNAFTVGAGIYTVTVKDANNCTTVTSAVTVSQPATLTASVNAGRITQCGGTSEVIVTAFGGTAPYTSGIGTFTKGPGTWIFAVTDTWGCADTAEVTIEPPGCMDLKVFPNPVMNSITVNHSVAQAGSTMQVFSISGALVLSKAVPQNAFQTTIDVNRLAAASYVLVYLNGNDWKQTLFVKVTLK